MDVARIFSQHNGPCQNNINSFDNEDKQSIFLRDPVSEKNRKEKKEEICTYQILPKQGAFPVWLQARNTSVEGYISLAQSVHNTVRRVQDEYLFRDY